MPSNSISTRARLQLTAVRIISRLPRRWQVALSGEPPVVVEGQQLDPMLQVLRSVRRRRGFKGLIHPSIEAGRRRYVREAHAFRGPMTPVGSVRDFEVPGAAGGLRVRHYAPASSRGSEPALVYLHGGGFVIGNLETHDEPCRILCARGRMHVLSVDYRLAPEHPFPAAVDDAAAAAHWVLHHAAAIGANPHRVLIGGDSAGGNLAAVVALQLAGSTPALAAQLLIYPATDVRMARPSHALFGEGYLLTREDRQAFFSHYARHVDISDPRLSPFAAPRFSGAPPAFVVVAGFDVLRDEGIAYAEALSGEGVAVHLERYSSLEHGFIHLTGVAPAAQAAVQHIATEWRKFVDER
jgi:acetyl esterase